MMWWMDEKDMHTRNREAEEKKNENIFHIVDCETSFLG